jgi:hypothetical protein
MMLMMMVVRTLRKMTEMNKGDDFETEIETVTRQILF